MLDDAATRASPSIATRANRLLLAWHSMAVALEHERIVVRPVYVDRFERLDVVQRDQRAPHMIVAVAHEYRIGMGERHQRRTVRDQDRLHAGQHDCEGHRIAEPRHDAVVVIAAGFHSHAEERKMEERERKTKEERRRRRREDKG